MSMEGKLIYQKIADVMRDLSAVGKDGKNAQQGYAFRKIDDVYNALHPIMAKHGIFTNVRVIKAIHREKMESAKGNTGYHQILEIEYTFYAEDSSCISTLVWGEANDWADKVTNKCLSAAHKYALVQVFCIPTLDLEDADSQTNEATKPKEDGGKQSVVSEKETRIVDAFSKHKVTRGFLENYLKKSLKSISEKEADLLLDIYRKLESGATIKEAFVSRADLKLRGEYDSPEYS